MTTLIHGIDVSAWQPRIDWNKVAGVGNRFAFIKATEGRTYRSPTFHAQVDGARSAGLLAGYYHFARWEIDPAETQAEHFVRVCGDMLRPGTLPPVLDLEWCSTGKKDAAGKTIYHRRPAAEIADWTLRFLKRLHALTGRIPIVYTGPSFWASYLPKSGAAVDEIATYPLWTVDYQHATKPAGESLSRAGEPKAARPGWQWDFWQWTGSGRVDGVTKDVLGRELANCDRNWFRGTERELRLFALLDGEG